LRANQDYRAGVAFDKARLAIPETVKGRQIMKQPAREGSRKGARLGRLVERNGRDVVPASAMAPPAWSTNPKRASTTSKSPKTRAKKASGPRLARLEEDSAVIETERRALVGYARVSTDEQTTALQLDALRGAGCAVIYEDSASGASRSRPNALAHRAHRYRKRGRRRRVQGFSSVL
jgi:hypothetical protein